MARSADETRRKLFDASVAEFATYGIAGARVDRITATAGVNNALLYRYFGSKSELFDTVFGILAAELLEAVPFTLDDLPGYAAPWSSTTRSTPRWSGSPPGTGSNPATGRCPRRSANPKPTSSPGWKKPSPPGGSPPRTPPPRS